MRKDKKYYEIGSYWISRLPDLFRWWFLRSRRRRRIAIVGVISWRKLLSPKKNIFVRFHFSSSLLRPPTFHRNCTFIVQILSWYIMELGIYFLYIASDHLSGRTNKPFNTLHLHLFCWWSIIVILMIVWPALTIIWFTTNLLEWNSEIIVVTYNISEKKVIQSRYDHGQSEDDNESYTS